MRQMTLQRNRRICGEISASIHRRTKRSAFTTPAFELHAAVGFYFGGVAMIFLFAAVEAIDGLRTESTHAARRGQDAKYDAFIRPERWQ
jgi:hypothetical protein